MSMEVTLILIKINKKSINIIHSININLPENQNTEEQGFRYSQSGPFIRLKIFKKEVDDRIERQNLKTLWKIVHSIMNTNKD